MSRELTGGRRSTSPVSSGRSSPVPRAERRAVEDELYRADKSLRRYGALIERAVNSWDTAPQEWADYIAFLARLLKAIQSHPKDAPVLPHTEDVAYKLAQCLNPLLPSGVHQKALEVYTNIFQTFGLEYLSRHLPSYLPGLAPVFTFASLSVRPAVYTLFEQYIIKLPTSDLRPATKALLLCLLPALEEETSEDFGRALIVVESLQETFDSEDGQTGFFWQTLFLCVVTSPSRRQGALNCLTRRLPKFINRSIEQPIGSMATEPHDLDGLSEDVKAVISPEPGLLIRCFAAGLWDINPLVQRGFLELLVTHLPLSSPVLRHGIDGKDLDLLVSAATSVLLRKDMGLNRRLWSWLLGPESKLATTGSPSSSPTTDRTDKGATGLSSQHQYFQRLARPSLTRCLLTMFSSVDENPATRSRPFRICSSLMDRWEIGGSIMPDVFLPAMKSVHVFSGVAPTTAVAEVQRSASLFFDGVEAKLIWAIFIGKIQSVIELSSTDPSKVGLLIWILEKFNIQDEEMVNVHIPLTTLYLLGKLDDLRSREHASGVQHALQLARVLVELMPSRTGDRKSDKPQADAEETFGKEAALRAITEFYSDVQQGIETTPPPLDCAATESLLMQMAAIVTLQALDTSTGILFHSCLDLFVAIQVKAPKEPNASTTDDLDDKLVEMLEVVAASRQGLELQTLSSIVAYIAATKRDNATGKNTFLRMVSSLAELLWQHLSPSTPKYHVEAARLLWQLETIAAPEEVFEVALLGFMQPLDGTMLHSGNFQDAREETVRRFTVLWDHSIPLQIGAGPSGQSRRASSLLGVIDPVHVAYRTQLLAESFSRVVDLLREPSCQAYEVAKRWLGNLPSLGSIFGLMFTRFQALVGAHRSSRGVIGTEGRSSTETAREVAYILAQLESILKDGTDWTWECIVAVDTGDAEDNPQSGLTSLMQQCIWLLNDQRSSTKQLHRGSVALMQIILDGPAAVEIRDLRIDESLLERMVISLRDQDATLQSPLLQLITAAIRLRVKGEITKPVTEARRRSSLADRRRSLAAVRPIETINTAPSTITPPPQLMPTLQVAFASSSARLFLEQWVAFLSTILPTFASAIFPSLLPLVETLCTQLESMFAELVALTTAEVSRASFSPDIGIVCLLDALEMTLARAHDCLALEGQPEEATKLQVPSGGFLSSVASGVFKVQGPPSRMAHANSRLTVVLAFQDTIRCCLKIWTWSNNTTATEGYDKSSSATTACNALRLRNKTRYLLEQMFAVEPLETLEVMIDYWSCSGQTEPAATTFSLLQVMQSSRPKHVLPVILDSLCSRVVPSGLPPVRQSSQATEITANQAALFLLAYLRSMEDDALDEVWADSSAFIKDVLANPLPYRHIMPILLALVHLLAQKIGNTNYGDQKRMRKDLADMFQKLLAATFTTLSPDNFARTFEDETIQDGLPDTGTTDATNRMDVLSVLQRAVVDLDTVLDSTDRVATVITSISNSVLSPAFNAKTFPSSVSPEHLDLLLAMSKRAPTSKAWRKELTEAFNNPRLLTSPVYLLQTHWLPVLHQWSARDKDRMSELFSRLTAPTTAGLMFGVGANAARLEADRRTQLNLRRVCLLLLASPLDTWVTHLRDFDEKLVELFEATSSSSPSSAIKADLYMLCRALTLAFSGTQLSPLWPTINANLQSALTSLLRGPLDGHTFTNISILQACKLLDQLVLLSPEEFQLHEWLFIADTVDAVYQPSGQYATSALADQVADVLRLNGTGDQQVLGTLGGTNTEADGQRRLLLQDDALPTDDIKAMDREDFGRTVLRPFLSQLGIHAYEGTYTMEPPTSEACYASLLKDLTDMNTVVA
ncbi:hypothetical protein LTR91_009471 [Friedmanniomyces endolithicus]|uniref:Dopey N-terminal domain-containing protein n=1 Tax=Friedmanniomyces endolithicus TaxID=329885 RepID=A0AAN6KL61_9PEZI|nr:hypothetical protein LTR57_003868 [Friedmanniomyces endolithicus]KAK0988949.1 hypothetical protein LTR91_009471 [Friedmanniomyces endolithicus]KAK1049544.1 hypothetical protein LTS16_003821 [Friedmanniomyces endolithicus]